MRERELRYKREWERELRYQREWERELRYKREWESGDIKGNERERVEI